MSNIILQDELQSIRDEFFEKHTKLVNGIKKVDTAPHDIFNFFKRKFLDVAIKYAFEENQNIEEELRRFENLQDLCENYYLDFNNMQFQQDLEEFLKNYNNEKPKIIKRKEEGTGI